MNDAYDFIAQMTVKTLEFHRKKSHLISPELIRDMVDMQRRGPATEMFGDISDAEAESLARDLETMFNIYLSDLGGEMEGGSGHMEWLSVKKNDIDWSFWNRYRSLMVEDEGRPSRIFDESVGEKTDKILGYLEDPTRPGEWERRGLVAGQVQSGKTSNYIGLTNKALDAGYKLVIILAGAHDSLRSQTQSRVNEGVLGFNTVHTFSGTGSARTGVGLKAGPLLPINCSTTVETKGDFQLNTAKQAHQSIGGDPTVLVVKKNSSILQNVYAWATGLTHTINPETGKKIVRDIPLLVIDDEADYASIDTSKKESPSRINGLIREILDTFEKSAYVAYTATPFANIFINPDSVNEKVGKDLFPEHFIVRLPEASNYSGPIRFFGVEEDLDTGLEQVDPLPTLRDIKDHEPWLRDGHKPTEMPEDELPASLREAVQSFLIATAIGKLRNLKQKHASMLVHVTRFKDVQSEVAYQLNEYVEELRLSFMFDVENAEDHATEQMRRLFEQDFAPTTASMLKVPDVQVDCRELPDWGEVSTVLRDLLEEEKVAVQIVNGSVKDSLMYAEHEDGLCVIAVGGDKLSRGLTLEGLTTSYYLRTSKMYDTLMQMGRWFGYRPGYLDLCRIYTTPLLTKWYARITDATAKLYREFEIMGQLGRTPRQYGFRVQQHPDGLMVTARNKSQHAQKMYVSFAGTQCETLLFDVDRRVREDNWKALAALTADVFNNNDDFGKKLVAHDVSPRYIVDFLDRYRAHRDSGRGLPKPIAEYISKCTLNDELTNWTVLVASKSSGEVRHKEVGDGMELGLYERSPFPKKGQPEGRRTIKRLVSTGDELLPLKEDSDKWNKALKLAIDRFESGKAKPGTKRPEKPSAHAERIVRDPNHGFLMVYPVDPASFGIEDGHAPFVGFAVSFPFSENAPTIGYQVNSVYWDSLIDDVDDVDEEPEEEVAVASADGEAHDR